MSVAIACTPTSPRATVDFSRIDVTGAATHTMTGYDGTVPSQQPGSPTQYPTAPEVRQYLAFVKGGKVLGKSAPFTPATDGTFTFNDYLFPSSGSWTVALRLVADDSDVATLAVTVQ